MQRVHNFFVRHHILGSIVAALVFWLVMITASYGLVIFFPGIAASNSYIAQAAAEIFAGAAAFGLAALFGYFRIWRARGSGFGKGLLTGGYFIFVSLYSLCIAFADLIMYSNIERIAPAWEIAVFLIAMLLVGFTEEIFFRGIVANLFLDKLPRNKYGVWSAVIGSGLVFGLIHLGNALSIPDVGGVLVQTFVASAMGMALSAIYFRTRNIWTVIFIHGFVDICALFVPTVFTVETFGDTISSYSGAMFIGIVPYIIVCLVLLRKSKMNTICRFTDPELQAQSEAAAVKIFRKYLFVALGIGAAIIAAYFITTLI